MRNAPCSWAPETRAKFCGHAVVSPLWAGEDVVRFTCVASSGRVRHLVVPGVRMARLLMIGSSARTIRLADGSDHPTGYLAEEVLEPYEMFEDADSTW